MNFRVTIFFLILGMWASQICIMDVNGDIIFTHCFPQNEAVTSIALVKFAGHNQHSLVVGIAKDLQLNPRICNSGFLDLYKVSSPSLYIPKYLT